MNFEQLIFFNTISWINRQDNLLFWVEGPFFLITPRARRSQGWCICLQIDLYIYVDMFWKKAPAGFHTFVGFISIVSG